MLVSRALSSCVMLFLLLSSLLTSAASALALLTGADEMADLPVDVAVMFIGVLFGETDGPGR